jgi:hypothetical protein
MRPHQTFPELAVVWHGKVEQLVDDDVVTDRAIHT